MPMSLNLISSSCLLYGHRESASPCSCSYPVDAQSKHRRVDRKKRDYALPSKRRYKQLTLACTALERETPVASVSTDGPGLVTSGGHILKLSYTPTDKDEEAPTSRQMLNRKIKMADSLQQVLEVIQSNFEEFDHTNVTHALQKLSKLYTVCFGNTSLWTLEGKESAVSEVVQPALKLCEGLILRHLSEFEPQDVSLCLWSYGLLNHHSDMILRLLCSRGTELCRHYKPIDCATSLQGLALLRYHPLAFTSSLVDQALHLLQHYQEWRPRELATLVWSLAKIPHNPGRMVLDAMMDATVWKIDEFKIQELVIITYGYASLKCRSPLYMIKVTNSLAPYLHLMKPQDVANFLLACSRVNFKPGPNLLDPLPTHIMNHLEDYQPREICQVLLALARFNHVHPPLLEAILDVIPAKVSSFNSLEISIVLYAMGRLKYTPVSHVPMELLLDSLVARGRSLSTGEIAVSIKGCGRLKIRPDPVVIKQLVALAIEKLRTSRPWEICHLMVGCAYLGYRDARLVHHVVENMQWRLKNKRGRIQKITIETVVYCCRKLGFMPHSLVDVAEMEGMYVRGGNPQDPSLKAVAAYKKIDVPPEYFKTIEDEPYYSTPLLGPRPPQHNSPPAMSGSSGYDPDISGQSPQPASKDESQQFPQETNIVKDQQASQDPGHFTAGASEAAAVKSSSSRDAVDLKTDPSPSRMTSWGPKVLNMKPSPLREETSHREEAREGEG